MRVDSLGLISGDNSVNSLSCNRTRKSIPYVRPVSKMVQLNFTGSGLNVNQILSISPENNGMGIAEYKQGGEGCVGDEMPASMVKHGKKDARSVMPYCSHNNPKGGYKLLLHPESAFKQGALPDEIPDKWFYSAAPGETLEQVAKTLGYKPSEISYVIQSKPNGSGPEAKSKYVILEPTSVKGEVRRMSDEVLGEIKTIPYELFKISSQNPNYVKLKSFPNYVMFTKELARTAKPYSYDAWGNSPFETEIITSDEMRAIADTLAKEKMNTKEFEYFKPAGIIAHDRHAHSIANHIANLSAKGNVVLNGVKLHIIEHNPGFNYQGRTDDPFKYLRIVADESDLEALKKMPEFAILQKAQKFGINNVDALTPREREIAWKILDPALKPFKDAFGYYNVIKSGIVAVKKNPNNISLGTVSLTFDKEMKSQETPDAAKSLTDDFASIPTKSVVNGSTPANLRLNDPEANFGRGNNGLSANKAGFTTFEYDGTNIKEVNAAREKNAKWLTDLVFNAYQKGQDELNKVFFNEAQIMENQRVLGFLKPMKDGDMLVMGWGRPDDQKGFNITLDGFKKYLERKDIPLEQKLKYRFAIGAGKWNENAKDYKSIVRLINDIETMDDGAYKGLVMYVDGFFPNRLVGCAQYGIFTSRREMCGITPLECKAAGVPYLATKTGGPVDYTNKLNGFLTDEAVEGRPERYGLTWQNSIDEIDDARCNRQAEQVADRLAQMADEYVNNQDAYIAKCKKNIEEKIDWHENSEYNGGKSAMNRYLEDILETDKPFDSRSKTPWARLIDRFGELKESGQEVVKKASKTKPIRIILAILGVAAVGGGVYYWYKNNNSKKLDKAA